MTVGSNKGIKTLIISRVGDWVAYFRRRRMTGAGEAEQL